MCIIMCASFGQAWVTRSRRCAISSFLGVARCALICAKLAAKTTAGQKSQHAQPLRFLRSRQTDALQAGREPVGRLAFARAQPDLRAGGIDQR
jgi:hypothetical protein